VNLSGNPDNQHLYKQFYESRWVNTLAAHGAHCREARTLGRMVIGLGDASVLETSVTLHRTYGVPYIPGSALKGLAAAFVRTRLANTEWGKWDDEHKPQHWIAAKPYEVVFGDTAQAGYITFFDALYVPNTGHNEQALYPDVITVHHPDYYQDKGNPPADWDSPTPIPFLSATGNYLIALAAQPGCDAWVNLTFDLLGHALRELGIGAKTSSGYGRMELTSAAQDAHDCSVPTHSQEAAPDPDQQQVTDLIHRIQSLSHKQVAGELNKFVQEWRQLTVSETLKRQVAQAILDKNRQAGREKKTAEKNWYRELVASLTTDGKTG
jgi:CRISPR-associated protein Cmr6